MHRPWMDAFIEQDGENRLCPRAKPSSIYASIVETLRLFRISVCTCVCAGIYIFSLFLPSFCLLLCTQGLHGNANRSR